MMMEMIPHDLSNKQCMLHHLHCTNCHGKKIIFVVKTVAKLN